MPSCKAISLSRFLSTLSLRRATLTYKSGYASDSISIHALLAESDYRPGPFQLSRTEFLSTLSLRRATRSAPEQLRTVRVFLSTLSLRRATARGRDRAPAAAISIHALLAESDNNGVLLLFGQPISIHALLAESDTSAIGFAVKTALFLSTLSLRRATADEFYVAALTNISIHALLAESDCIIMDKLTKPDGISIHALLAESDFAVAVNIKVMGNFYPRSPCGERPLPSTPPNRLRRISIHALLAESDPYAAAAKLDRFQFLSTLSLRRAT